MAAHPLIALGQLAQAFAQGPGVPRHAPTGSAPRICFQYRDTGRCSRGDSCTFQHSGTTNASATLIGADAASRGGHKAPHDKGITHDFHGFTTGAMPDNKKFAQITVVEHEDIVAKLSTTIDGQLRYRMIPIHAEAFDPVAELLLYFDSHASCQGKPVTKEAIQRAVQDMIHHLARAGWKPCKPQDGNAQPQSGLSPEIAPLLESIRELTSAVRQQASSSSSHGKRDAHPRPGEVAKQLQNMSVARRQAALQALGMPGEWPANSMMSSPPHKIFAATPGAFTSAGGHDATHDVYCGDLFKDEEDDLPPSAPELPVADASHEFLALVRAATSELPYVREKAPFDIADPVHISQFDGMLGPWDSRLPVTKLFPGLQDILGDQPPQVLSMMKELIPKIVRQLNLVAKPGTRLDLLYKTYGLCFQSRGQQDAGVVGLGLCISRQANLLTCTPDVPTV